MYAVLAMHAARYIAISGSGLRAKAETALAVERAHPTTVVAGQIAHEA